MVKKGLLALVIATLAVGGVFAQSDFASMAKNTVTVDVGPTIVGFAFGKVADFIDAGGITSSGLGIGGQFERQLSRPLSVAGRFAYLRADMGLAIKDVREEGSGSLTTDIDLSSFSAEGHVRFYPFGDTFFLDGMLGYAQLKTDITGRIKVEIPGAAISNNERIEFSASRNYLKLGAKLGWRFSFGKNGGFTFEPAAGYSYGIGLGSKIDKQLSDYVGSNFGGYVDTDITDVFSSLENYVFIGGPRVSLAFGYRF